MYGGGGMSWKEKVILVGGVGSGLGSAVVSTLGAAGATTIGVARNAESLGKLGELARARGWNFHPEVADLGAPAPVAALVQRVLKDHGRIDGLSLNMGRWIPGDTLLHKTTDAEWASGLNDNLNAIFQVTRAALPSMMERGSGSIVIVSAADRVRLHGNVSYCVAKGGLIDLARKLSADYRPHGIRVNVVLPGTMEHNVDPAVPPVEAGPFGLRDSSGSGAWEVARAIRFLLSDEARWITGVELTVDGGFSTRGKESGA